MQRMIKILFVCHGNICRSPMAEFIFKDMVSKAGLQDEFYVESAATSSEEIWRGVGNPIYPPARRELEEHGVPYEDHRAVQITKADYDRFDLLIGMDLNNLSGMRWITGGDPQGKMHLLLDYTDRRGDVADPWYSGNFRKAWNDIYEGCEALLYHLSELHGLKYNRIPKKARKHGGK